MARYGHFKHFVEAFYYSLEQHWSVCSNLIDWEVVWYYSFNLVHFTAFRYHADIFKILCISIYLGFFSYFSGVSLHFLHLCTIECVLARFTYVLTYCNFVHILTHFHDLLCIFHFVLHICGFSGVVFHFTYILGSFKVGF